MIIGPGAELNVEDRAEVEEDQRDESEETWEEGLADQGSEELDLELASSGRGAGLFFDSTVNGDSAEKKDQQGDYLERVRKRSSKILGELTMTRRC